MQLNIKVPPFNTTLMGIIRGVADLYGLACSDAMLYGLSGHAFLINIHDTLCPSGPYCWNRRPFYQTLRNIGIQMAEGPFFSSASTPETRRQAEAALIDRLEHGEPCGFVNDEYQLIVGTDATGFITTQPWPNHDYPPKHLTFTSWQEFGQEVHVFFFTFDPVSPIPAKEAVVAGLRYALAVADHPENHSGGRYHAGLEAFDVWIKAVEAGQGGEHGNWWNGWVWAECRRQAAAFFAELASQYPEAAELTSDLQAGYQKIAENLLQAADKKMAVEAKVSQLREARDCEAQCLGQIRHLVGILE